MLRAAPSRRRLQRRGNAWHVRFPAMTVSNEQGVELEPRRLAEWLDTREVQIVDVRELHEFEAGHLPGARQIEFDEISAEAGSLDRGAPLVFVCRGGTRSGMVAEAFRTGGFDAYHLDGGLLAWMDEDRPLEPDGGTVAER